MVTGLFNDSYPPIIDGVAMAVRSYTYWLNKKYGRACAIVPEAPGFDIDEPFEVLRFKSVPIPTMAPYRWGITNLDHKFVMTVMDVPFDIVHSHCPFLSGRLALRVSKKRNIPIITTFHTKYKDDFLRVLHVHMMAETLVKVIIKYYNSIDHVWTVNRSTGEVLKDYGFKGNYEVIPNGSDMPVPSKLEYDEYRTAGQKMIGTDNGKFVFLFVGQHRWEKNVKLIIEGLDLMNKRGIDFQMIFAGSGYASGDMKQMVEDLGLSNMVKFMGMITSREELKSLYARADLFLFPSLYDNAPLVMREAAAFEVPAVLARGSSAAEKVIDGENGFLTENNPADFADKLNFLLQNREMIEIAGMGARRTIFLPWESIIDEVHQRYSDIINTFKKISITV
jgi:1,2-diacylglycerol 3-alpha-glucosyltransferase